MRRAVTVIVLGAFSSLPSGCERDTSPRVEIPVHLGENEALFTPWHAKDEPIPFVQDEQWHWRNRLSWSPDPPIGEDDPAAAAALDEGMARVAERSVLQAEELIDELEEVAGKAPRALAAFLTDAARDVRWAAARLMYRRILAADPARSYLTEQAALHLRDEADEVSLLLLDCIARSELPWTTARLIKTFGRYDNHLLVVLRARAAAHLAERGYPCGVDLFLKILKEHTALEDDQHREFDPSLRSAWWKEESLRGIRFLAGHDFGFSPDAPPAEQEKIIREMSAWWDDQRVALWEKAPPLEDPALKDRVHELILALGTFQLRNVDNAIYLLTHLGPPTAPEVLAAIDGSSFVIRRHCLEIVANWMPMVGEATRRTWIDRIARCLKDPDDRIREVALQAIGAAKVDDAIPHLAKGLEGGPGIAEVALRALSEFGTPKARQMLVEFRKARAATDPLMIPALAALIASGDHSQLEAFLDLLRGENPLADRASIYLTWIVDGDSFSQANTPEQREQAIRRIEADLRAQEP